MGMGIACSETKRGLWCDQNEGTPPLSKASLLTYLMFSHLVLMNATFWSLGRHTTGHKNGKTHGMHPEEVGRDRWQAQERFSYQPYGLLDEDALTEGSLGLLSIFVLVGSIWSWLIICCSYCMVIPFVVTLPCQREFNHCFFQSQSSVYP